MTQQYRECPDCHAHLDPGERCDCGGDGTRDADPPKEPRPIRMITMEDLQRIQLQNAYASHMVRPGARRLPWMEAAIDALQEMHSITRMDFVASPAWTIVIDLPQGKDGSSLD